MLVIRHEASHKSFLVEDYGLKIIAWLMRAAIPPGKWPSSALGRKSSPPPAEADRRRAGGSGEPILEARLDKVAGEDKIWTDP